MPKLTRKTQKIFCGNADNDQLAVFGSMATGSPVYTDDIEQLQNSTAYGEGWEAATLEDKAPFMEEMNGLQYGLSKQIAYTFQEGIPEYDANTTYYIGSIVKTLNEGKPILYTSIIDENINNPLTDLTSWEELKLGGGGLPIGTVIPVTASVSYVPENTLYADGVEFSGAEGQKFRNLWTDYILTGKLDTCSYSEYETDLAIYGQCIKWAVDTANEKFRIPLIKDGSVIQQAGTNSIGKSFNAGLPNITGTANTTGSGNVYRNTGIFSGAFTATYDENISADGYNAATSSSYYDNLAFDASLSNPIYGNSDTVQMNAVAVRHFVVVATGSINQNEADWSEFASSLASKANNDLSNCTRPYVIETSDKSLLPSWYRVWSDGWCEQGGRLSSSTGTVTLLKKYKEPNYYANLQQLTNTTGTSNQYASKVRVLSVDSFTYYINASEGFWEAKGYIN